MRLRLRQIKGIEYRDGKSFKKVDDSYMIWYDVLIGMMAMCLMGAAFAGLIGFIVGRM